MSTLFRKRSDDVHAVLAPDDPYYVRQAYSSSSGGGGGRSGSSFSAPSFDDRFIYDEDREVFVDRNGRGLGNSREGSTVGKKLRSFPWTKSKPSSITVPRRTPSPRPTTPTSMAPLPPSPVTPIADQFTTHGLGIYTTASPRSVAPLSPGRTTDGPTLAQFPAPPSSLPSVTSTLSSAYSSTQSVPSRMQLPLPTRRSSLIGGAPSGSGGHTFNGSVSTVSTFETTSSFASSKLFHSSVDDDYDSSSDATTMSSLTSSPESKTRRTTSEGRRMWKTKGLQESPLRPDQVLPPSQQHRRDDGLRPPCEEDEDAYFASASTSGPAPTTTSYPIPTRRNSTPMPDFVAAMLGIEPETPPRPKRWSASSNKPAADSPPFDLAREKAAASQMSQQTVRSLVGANVGHASPTGSASADDADDEVSPPRSRQAPIPSLGGRSRIPSIRFEGFAMDSVFAEVEKNLLRSKASPTPTPTIEVVEPPAEQNPFVEAEADHDTKLRERKNARRRTRVISAYRPSQGYFNVEEDEVTLSPAPQVMDALRSESPLAAAQTAHESDSSSGSGSVRSLSLPSSSQQLMAARPRPGPRRAQPRPARLDVDLANSLTAFDRLGLVTPTSASTVTPYDGVVSSSADSIFSATNSEGTTSLGGVVSPVSIIAQASTPSSPPAATVVAEMAPPALPSPPPAAPAPAPVVLQCSVSNADLGNSQTPPLTPTSPVTPASTAASPPSPPLPTRPSIPSVFVFPPNGPSYRHGESSDWEAPPKPPVYSGPTKVTLVQPKRMIRASTRPVSSLPKRNIARQPLIVTPVVVATPGPLPPSPALSSTSTIHPQRQVASPVGWSFPPREQLPSPPASVSARGSPDLGIRPASFSPSDESGSDCDPLQTMMSRLNAPHTPPRAARTHSTSTPTNPRSNHPNGLTMIALLRHTNSQTGLSMLERELESMTTSSSRSSFEGGPQILVTAPPHDDDEEVEHVDHGFDVGMAASPVPVPHLMRAASKSSSSSSGGSTNVDTILTTYGSDDSVTRYGDAPLLHSNVAPPLVPIIIDSPTVPDSEHARSLSGSSSSSSSSFSSSLVAEDRLDDDLPRGFSDESLLSLIDSEVDPIDVMSREIEDTLAEMEESVSSSSSASIASLMMECSVTPRVGSRSTQSPTSSSEDAFGLFPSEADSEGYMRGSAIPVQMTRPTAEIAMPSHSRNWSDASCSTVMTDSTESSTSSSSTNSSDEHHAEIAVVMTGQRISRRTGRAIRVIGQAM